MKNEKTQKIAQQESELQLERKIWGNNPNDNNDDDDDDFEKSLEPINKCNRKPKSTSDGDNNKKKEKNNEEINNMHPQPHIQPHLNAQKPKKIEDKDKSVEYDDLEEDYEIDIGDF